MAKILTSATTATTMTHVGVDVWDFQLGLLVKWNASWYGTEAKWSIDNKVKHIFNIYNKFFEAWMK